MLQGKKTYLVAIVTIIGAAASYYLGNIGLEEAINLAVTAVLAATVRHGITAETKTP